MSKDDLITIIRNWISAEEDNLLEVEDTHTFTYINGKIEGYRNIWLLLDKIDFASSVLHSIKSKEK